MRFSLDSEDALLQHTMQISAHCILNSLLLLDVEVTGYFICEDGCCYSATSMAVSWHQEHIAVEVSKRV